MESPAASNAATTDLEVKMKSLINAVAVAVILSAPALSFAQSSGGLTRAQVRADLVRVEQAGYYPGDGDNTQYPANIQAAEAKIAAEDAASHSYGGTPGGASASGKASPVK
jgi:hypothetical protein